MLIVSRSGWGAAPPESIPNRIPIPTPRLWVHHTGAGEWGDAGMRSIQRYHQDVKGWNDIAYSFVIDPDGTIYVGRGAGISGAHTEGDNFSSHAICVMGNYENTVPTTRVLNSLVALARHGRDQGWWTPTLGGHRDAPGASTACPGRHLYALLPRARQLVALPDNPNEEWFNMDRNTFISMFNDGEPVAERIQRQAGQAIAHQAETPDSQLRQGLRDVVEAVLTEQAEDPDSALRQAVRNEVAL